QSGPGGAVGGDDMSSYELPERPDLGQLRRRARELRDAVRAGDSVAQERVARQLPAPRSPLTLAEAQLVVAREHGFAATPRLKIAVQGQAVSLHEAVEANEVALVRRLLESGADPDLGNPIGHAVEHRDHRCLGLLI